MPTVLQRGQIHVGNKDLIDHLDAYSAPRLVEYFDENPCDRPIYELSRTLTDEGRRRASKRQDSGEEPRRHDRGSIYGRRVRHPDPVGAAKQWAGNLAARKRLPDPRGRVRILTSYIKQNLKFFVAKVNLKEQAKLGSRMLRPIQVAYESPNFMLPIRLGTANADGPQELFVYALTQRGRVEATNYRTVKLPTVMDLPLYVKEQVPDFYRAMFSQQVKKENMSRSSPSTPGT